MSIVMKRKYDFDTANFSKDELPIVTSLLESFRVGTFDDVPEKNILDKMQFHYTDKQIISLITKALRDINATQPASRYSLVEFVRLYETELLIKGAIVFALMGEGLLQLRNQVDYNDNGLSIAMFNKTGQYQSWLTFLLQEYMQEKQLLKAAMRANSPGAGFFGIASEFSYYGW